MGVVLPNCLKLNLPFVHDVMLIFDSFNVSELKKHNYERHIANNKLNIYSLTPVRIILFLSGILL